MINILGSYQDGIWRVIIVPRRKHRPDVYSREGDGRVVISPAAVDVGGLIVTPLERDFERVNAAMVQAIFDEVVLDKKTVDQVLSAL
jgi:hypothetical protein